MANYAFRFMTLVIGISVLTACGSNQQAAQRGVGVVPNAHADITRVGLSSRFFFYWKPAIVTLRYRPSGGDAKTTKLHLTPNIVPVFQTNCDYGRVEIQFSGGGRNYFLYTLAPLARGPYTCTFTAQDDSQPSVTTTLTLNVKG